MAETKAKRNPDRCPSHPGAVLDDIMPSSGKPKAEIARLPGISRQHLHEILEGKNPSAPTVQPGSASLSATDRPSGFACRQLTMHAEREVDVSKIPTLKQA
jgi:hypothetical protein